MNFMVPGGAFFPLRRYDRCVRKCVPGTPQHEGLKVWRRFTFLKEKAMGLKLNVCAGLAMALLLGGCATNAPKDEEDFASKLIAEKAAIAKWTKYYSARPKEF